MHLTMNTKQIGIKLRKIRNSQNLSIINASKKIGISPATLWKIETGSAPAIQRKTKIAITQFLKTPTVVEAIAPTNTGPVETLNSVNTFEIVKISRQLTELAHQLQMVQNSILTMGLSKLNS